MTVSPGADSSTENVEIIEAAKEALRRGYSPVPIRPGSKAPLAAGWQDSAITLETVEEVFGSKDAAGIGLRLGAASSNLVDIDLDHPIAWRLANMFLPPTRMRSGRVGNPNSHFWYRVTGDLPGYKKYTLPPHEDESGGETLVEIRSSSGHQTVIPPSTWHPKNWDGKAATTEEYRWEAEPWGGEDGPTEISGKALAVRVETLAMTAMLVENWPKEGSRHDAYLALAGGMLRFGVSGVHPYWKRVLPQLIEALAEATHDDDGANTRIGEVIPSTEAKLYRGTKVQGWGTLAEILGQPTVDHVRKRVEAIERLVDWQQHMEVPKNPLLEGLDDYDPESTVDAEHDDAEQHTPPKSTAAINPLDARGEFTWQPVNMEPYLAGEVVVPEPSILRRSDGKAIFYPGRVNSMYGKSESAKSWVAMYACLQEMALGGDVMYVDLEDDPAMTLKRMRALGAYDDDVRAHFTYLRPEGPHALMQRDTWGTERPTELGSKNASMFRSTVEQTNPGLIVVDGMSVLYGLHGLNPNDVTSTDVITNWLKGLCRNGRTTVIVIDHTNKGAEKGATPTGSQHKISMVQGAAIQVVPIVQPKPGAVGHVELVVGKDRPGEVRKIANDDKHPVVADVIIDSTGEDGRARLTIDPPSPDEVTIHGDRQREAKAARMPAHHGLMGKVAMVFAANPDEPMSKSDVDSRLEAMGYSGYSVNSLNEAFRTLQDRDEIVKAGPATGRNVKYIVVRPMEASDSDD